MKLQACFTTSMTTITRCKKRGGGAMEQISKLVCIFDYNKNMSGVDLLVQMMISYYPFTRKTLKWTKKIFYYFMEISANNAFVLYKVKSIQGSLIPTTRACGTVLLVTV